MQVKLEHLGWCAPPAGQEFLMPEGYHRYLCMSQNGIICTYSTTALVPDGTYELRDEDWRFDNPRFEAECEMIEFEQ